MIVKDGLEDLKRLQPLVKDHIDEWVVVLPPKDKAITWAKKNGIKVIVKDFTQGIESEIIEKFKDYGLDVDKDYRLFNFASARNEGLKHCTSDYILWLDADDTPIGIDNMKKFIEKNPSEVYNALYDYARDEEGNPASDHWRERIVQNNGKWTWLGAKLGLIHETLIPNKGYNPYSMDIQEDIFRIEHNSQTVGESSIRNHIALLYEYIKTEGEDARTTYYLGIEYFNRGMFDYCVAILLEFVKKSGSQEDIHSAWIKIGEAYHMLKDSESGRNAYLKAIDTMPNRPDGYLGLGESYHDEGEWAKSNEYILTGMQKKLPKSKHGLDKTRYTFRPSGYVALNYLQLDKPNDAYEWFIRTLRLNPKHPWLKEYAPLFKEAKDLYDYVTSFVKLGQISQRLYPRTLPKLAEAVPDDLKSQEILMDFKWRYTKPKIWSSKSIVFFCSSAFEDWGPESLETGCGGSEEAVIQLTKRLAKLGWEVTVYNNCIKERTVDGVNWVRFENFNPRDVFNVLISWRNNQFVEDRIASKKFIDMHDVPEKEFYTDETTKDTKIFVKSEYHRSLFGLEDDRFIVIPNGIDIKQFNQDNKVKNNLVWTSSYDRGLQNLLEMWDDIKKEVPDATLDVYYGFELYDTTPWGKKPEGQKWKKYMLSLMEKEGITHHGRVGTDEIALAYNKADIWAYPTEFPEICCITATKAQAAGAIPVTTEFASLKERNQGIMVEAGNWQAFKEELISLMKDEPRKKEIREKLDVSAYDWEEITKRWDEALK